MSIADQEDMLGYRLRNVFILIGFRLDRFSAKKERWVPVEIPFPSVKLRLSSRRAGSEAGGKGDKAGDSKTAKQVRTQNANGVRPRSRNAADTSKNWREDSKDNHDSGSKLN